MDQYQWKMNHGKRGKFANGSRSNQKSRLKNATTSFPSFEFITSKFFIAITILYLLFALCHVNAKHHHPQVVVDEWASQFGDELNWLAKNMTKADEIKKQYKENNAKVEDKGELILKAVENVGRMFRRKTIAVRCIANKAEKLAEEFGRKYLQNANETVQAELQAMRNDYQYYSSKYSNINDVPCTLRFETKNQCSNFKVLRNATATYLNMYLQRDKHFYHINVNTSHTSVHVPTNVFDGGNDTKDVLIWSKALDEVMVANYNNDPALSWQYFGSETGVLRHFPAKSWEDRDTSSLVDVYDCRKRSWYIETATCSKDIAILLDRTGSMSGYLGFLATLTIKSLLDTFSNNDFFNIYTFSKNVTPLIECFRDELVQATPENIKVFNDEMGKKFKTLIDGYANDSHIKKAIEAGLALLRKYRIKRNCDKTPCNQAIMLITDNIQGNFTDVFENFNRENATDGTERIPVRMFTYLLGKDQSNVEEMKSIACANRGKFSHIQTLDEVQEKVLDYVSAIAYPLVLQGEKHPPTWTHAFKDVTYRDEDTYVPESGKKEENRPPRLMIAVGVPAYKVNSTNGTPDYTGLLGVASTDVPVDDIDKLTLPYKLGVNAYPFIVSNNGFVLLHPDLRPMETFKIRDSETIEYPECQETNKTECVYLKKNYNSIDLTEVEQIDEYVDESNETIKEQFRPRIGNLLTQLRKLSLSKSVESMLNVSVRFHYDKMRRVSEEKYDYYFARLNSTPFTLGLAIPSTYGQTLIKVGHEIRNNINKGLNMSELFVGQNWKVHPDWVYCKFHYMEYQSFASSEEELLYFVRSFSNSTWKWANQYESNESGESEDEEHPNCTYTTSDKKSHYYCNKELVELLMFDARVTNTSYGTWEAESDAATALIDKYKATLRFVATMSGLTRWQFIFGENEVEGDKEFGDYYTKAIDETWYRSAVLQHKVDNESFIYSVPHDDKDDLKEGGNIKAMASHAIFRMDAGKEAPGCVVGFQFEQQSMYQQFKEIISRPIPNCKDCLRCDDGTFNCYVIDNNGYIILSDDPEDTGRFFGDVRGNAMRKLVDLKIFKPITVYDYQAVCKEPQNDGKASTSFGAILQTPFGVLKQLLQWICLEIILLFTQRDVWAWPENINVSDDMTTKPTPSDDYVAAEKIIYTLEACDKAVTLYVMDQKFEPPINHDSHDWLYFSRIKLSNLLLVAVGGDPGPSLDAEAKKINYTWTDDHMFPCHKKHLNELESRRLDDCFTEHCREYSLKTCSSSCKVYTINALVFSLVFLHFFINFTPNV